jgi:hypothetical protein
MGMSRVRHAGPPSQYLMRRGSALNAHHQRFHESLRCTLVPRCSSECINGAAVLALRTGTPTTAFRLTATQGCRRLAPNHYCPCINSFSVVSGSIWDLGTPAVALPQLTLASEGNRWEVSARHLIAKLYAREIL